MPLPQKRRRPNDKPSEDDKEAKLRRKLHHALRELRKVVKKARTFEVQRTLKKLKDARREDPKSDVEKDLEAQMEALQHFDYDQLARSALATKLKKDKTLFADPAIQAISAELVSNLQAPVVPGSPAGKVQSRIMSSKVLASEVVSIVETFRMMLHPRAGSADRAVEGTDKIAKKRRTAPSSQGSSGVSSSGDHAIAEADDGWESGTVDALSETDNESVGESADNDEDHSWHMSQGQSEFLPSLSVGFTRGNGNSDSEFSDGEMKLVDGIKKNRRGQRARRAIWEKKFGRNANHLKKSQRTAKRGTNRTNVDRGSATGQSGAHDKPTLGVSEAKAEVETILRRGDLRGKQGERPLHPSWEAKRKQKVASIVPSQGSKIVFSDS